MKIEDIDREFRELARSLKEAQQAFRSGNFAQAEPLYRRALELTERSYGEEHADTASCIQNLAETYYSLRRFRDAVPLFRRLLIIKEKQYGVGHAEVASVLFKLAKTYEKLGMAGESESFYRRALRVGEQVYGKDSSFVATILESFAGMLRRAQIRLHEAEQMEERIRDIREKTGNSSRITASFLGQLAASIPPDSDQAAELAAHARTLDKGADTSRLRSLKQKQDRPVRVDDSAPAVPVFAGSHVVMIAVACVLGLGLIGAGAAFYINSTKQPAQPASQDTKAWDVLTRMLKQPGGEDKTHQHGVLVFTAPDGRKQVTLVDEHQVLFTRGTNDYKGAYNDDGSSIVVTPDGQSIPYRYQKSASGLIDSEGSVLYASDAAENVVIQKMKTLAVAANRYYRLYGQYPNKAEKLLAGDQNIGYTNPFNREQTLPIRRNLTAHEEESSDMNLNDFADMQNAIRQMAIWTPQTIPPGSIEFFRAAAGPEGDMFMIRGGDRNGNVIRGSRPGTTFLIVCSNGRGRF